MEDGSGVKVCEERMIEERDNEYGQDGAFADYEIKDAAECIIRAEKIKGDEKMMRFVSKCLEKEAKASKKAYTSIEDLEERRQELAKEDDNDGVDD